MKRLILMFAFLATMANLAPLFSQVNYYPVPWSIWLYDELTRDPLAGATIDASITYKDESDNVIYMEGHTGMTNDHGHFVFKVGDGFPMSGSLNAQSYKSISKFGYALNVTHEGNSKMVDGEQDVLAAGKANSALFSCDAGNAFGLGGFIFIFQPINFGWIVCPPEPDDYDYYGLFSRRDPNGLLDDEMVMSPMSDLIRMRQAEHVNNLDQIPFLSFGLGLGKPIFCGPDPQTIYGMHGITMPSLFGLRYGVDLRVLQEETSDITSTLNCENQNAGGYGVRALGATGMVAYGNTGNVGVTYGMNNGVGVYGVVNDPPVVMTPNFKYGLSGNSGGFALSYAAALFGLSITTDPIMKISDGRLKKNVRSTENALARINQLRPSTYEYLGDTPYHFREGLRHGFIAQEIETVFPELVAEVVLPKSLDYDKIGGGSGEQFKAIDYEGLIPILTASIQELDAKVVNLETQLVEMNNVVLELTAKVAALTDKE